MIDIGFTDYVDPLKLYLAKYRESVKGEKPEKKSVLKAQAKEAAAAAAAAMSSSSSSSGSIYHPPQGTIYKSPNMMQQQQQYIPPTQTTHQQSTMTSHVTTTIPQHQLLQQQQPQPTNVAYNPQYTTTQSTINPIQTSAVAYSSTGAVPTTTLAVIATSTIVVGSSTYMNDTVVNTNAPLVAPPKVLTSNIVYTTSNDSTSTNAVTSPDGIIPNAVNTHVLTNHTIPLQQVATDTERQSIPTTDLTAHPRPVSLADDTNNDTTEEGPHTKLAKTE